MDAAERREILSRYENHTRRFDELASRRRNGNGEVIPFTAPLRELEQEPTMREVEVLQLVADGQSNKQIGDVLGLSALTVKSHLARIARFNLRREAPTAWALEIHTGPDFLERMLRDRPGNVVVI